MTFSEALSTAEEFRRNKVITAGDLGDKWIFHFEEDAGKLGGAPMLIDKNSGSYEYVSSADFAVSLSGGVFDYQPINLKEIHKD